MTKQMVGDILWTVVGLTLVVVGAMVPASIAFPEPLAWVVLLTGFFIIILVARAQIVLRGRK